MEFIENWFDKGDESPQPSYFATEEASDINFVADYFFVYKDNDWLKGQP